MDGMYGGNPLFGYNNNSNIGTRFGHSGDVGNNESLQQELEQEIDREEKRQKQLKTSNTKEKNTCQVLDSDDDDDDNDDDDDDTEEDAPITNTKTRDNNNDDDDSDEDTSSNDSNDDDSDDNNKKKLKHKPKSVKQQQNSRTGGKYAMSTVKLRKKDKLHMKRLMRGIMKQAKQSEEEKLLKTITQTVLGTLNPTSASAAAVDIPILGQKRN